MVEDVGLRVLAEALVSALAQTGNTVTTAESCTGGWIAKAITDIPGSSAVFAYGFVSYSNDAKESLLDVQEQTLVDNGAVSESVVIEMAEGALELSDADYAVSVSGVAGPDGGSRDKPVGTVWIAWSLRDGGKIRSSTAVQQFAGNRNEVRVQTVASALQGVLDRVKERQTR
jgi:nicotinamide-nucleotide amidase